MNGGVSAVSWLDGNNLVIGTDDFSLKIIDIDHSIHSIKQSILTDYK